MTGSAPHGWIEGTNECPECWAEGAFVGGRCRECGFVNYEGEISFALDRADQLHDEWKERNYA